MKRDYDKFHWRITWKEFGRRDYVMRYNLGWSRKWWGRKYSGLIKRQLSKSRRRGWKNEVLYNHTRRGHWPESECDYKGW